MKMILHHLRKDIRAQRWLLLLSFLVIVLRIIVDLLETQPDYRLASMAEFVRTTMALTLVGSVLWILLLARLILSEPVTGATSFWLTRPIPRGVYIPSKLLFILLFLVIPYLIPAPLDMFHYGVDRERIWSSVKSSLIVDCCLAIIVLWFATYTRTITEFWIVSISAVLAAIVIGATVAYIRTYTLNGGIHSGEVMLTRWALFILVFFSALVISLLVQHTRRKAPAGFIVGISGVIAAVLIVFFWPFALPVKFAQAFFFGVSSDSEKSITIKFSDDWKQRFSWERNSSTQQWIGLSSFSPAVSTSPQTPIIQGISATFQLGGAKPERLSNDISGYIPAEGQFDVDNAIQADLPRIQLTNQPEEARPGSLSLFVIHPAEEPLIGKTGKLTISVYGRMQSLVREAEIPLNGPGITRQPGEVIHVARLPRIPQPLVVNDTKDKPVLAVWTLGYFSQQQQQFPLPSRYYVLVDSEKGTGTFLFTGNESQNGGPVGLTSKSSRHDYLSLAGDEPLDRMVLYVYELKPAEFFSASVEAPDFSMSPQ